MRKKRTHTPRNTIKYTILQPEVKSYKNCEHRTIRSENAICAPASNFFPCRSYCCFFFFLFLLFSHLNSRTINDLYTFLSFSTSSENFPKKYWFFLCFRLVYFTLYSFDGCLTLMTWNGTYHCTMWFFVFVSVFCCCCRVCLCMCTLYHINAIKINYKQTKNTKEQKK